MKTNEIIRLMLLMLLLSFIFYCTSGSPENDLRKALQSTYDHFVISLHTESENQIKSDMSSNGYALSKNYYANLKASFPVEMKKTAPIMPKLSNLNFVKVIHNGPTAALVYSKKIKDQYQSGPSIKFILIKFVDEGSGWKYDSMFSETTSKYNADGSEKQLNLSSLAPEYAIDGNIHPAPPILPEAEVVGVVSITSLGYKVEVIINDRIQAVIDNTTIHSYVKGGLKFGENSLKIKCKKIVSENKNANPETTISTQENIKFKEIFTKLNLTIKAKLEGKDEEVFKYKPGLKIEGTHAYTFIVL